MSYAITYDQAIAPIASEPKDSAFLPRSRYQLIPLVVPFILCGVSWLMGGLPMLTDAGFVCLTAICLVGLFAELIHFPRRFGIGGILVYGGVLAWFCHDYFNNWFNRDFSVATSSITPEIVAKAGCLYCFFIFWMRLGLQIEWGKWLPKFILRLPEPSSSAVYFWVWVGLTVIGFLPFVFFTYGGILNAMYNGAFGIWTGRPVDWTVGRTGNYNYSFGAYLAQVLQIGEFGSLAGIFYCVFVTRSWMVKFFAWPVWGYWTLYTFASGRRGEFAALIMPAIGLLCMKFFMDAAAAGKVQIGRPRQSLLAWAVGVPLILFTLFCVQFQGTFRGSGFSSTDLSQLSLTKNQGNSMFSEGLTGISLIPDQHDFFSNHFPGEGAVLAMPETLFWFVIGPLPRAIWTNKPDDAAMIWYNSIVVGGAGREGTTVSQGIVGHWYFRYGWAGVLEGGILVGWLMRVSERVLQGAGRRPLGVFSAMVLMVWLFRIYRNFYFNELYGWIIGAIVFAVLVKIFSVFGPRPASA